MSEPLAEDYMQSVERAIPDTHESEFVIDTLDRAAWAVRKIAAAEQRKAERLAFTEREQVRLLAWQHLQDARDQREIDWLTGLLQGYYHQQSAAGHLGKSRSIRLPHGALQARSLPDSWQVTDESALLVWAEANGQTRTSVKVTADWTTIKKNLEESSGHAVFRPTGEILECVTFMPGKEAFRVVVDETKE